MKADEYEYFELIFEIYRTPFHKKLELWLQFKNCHFGIKMGTWVIDYNDETISDKKLRFTGLENLYLNQQN